MLGVRPPDLHRVHDDGAGRHPLPRARGSGRAQAEAGRPAPGRARPAPCRRDDGAGDEGVDRDQRRHLPDHRGAGARAQLARRFAVLQVGARRSRRCEWRLVAAPHRRVPARGNLPHRPEHALAVLHRPTRRAVSRRPALPRPVSRRRPGRLGRRAPPGAADLHGRCVRRHLRHPRRLAHPRVAAHWSPRRAGDDVDRHQPRVQLQRVRNLLGWTRRRPHRRHPRNAFLRPLGSRQGCVRTHRPRRRARPRGHRGGKRRRRVFQRYAATPSLPPRRMRRGALPSVPPAQRPAAQRERGTGSS